MAAKRNAEKVKVRDPNGKVHEMSRPNASDLCQHAGWTIVFAGENVKGVVNGLEVTPEQQALAHAPRKLRPRDEARLDALEKSSPTSVHAQGGKAVCAQPLAPAVSEDDPDAEEVAEKAKPKRTPRARPVKDEDADGEMALVAVTPAVNAHAKAQAGPDEMAALEGEEDAREPKDE